MVGNADELSMITYLSFNLSSAALCWSTTRSKAARIRSARPWTVR